MIVITKFLSRIEGKYEVILKSQTSFKILGTYSGTVALPSYNVACIAARLVGV